ncbi:MAG: PhzF family phenazine biosynthesis protein [Polyangiaceae bacterium]|nr:PhzF family phenazine biosynthesis protein [Polyangiaceae bacterium]
MALTIWQVDAFTAAPLAGNPAAVCVLPGPREDAWLKAVAREMNLSETAFLVRRADGSFDLRWFTPAVEVDLCGHATLASAHVLWEEGLLPPSERARFHTRSGLLTAARAGGLIELDFPVKGAEPLGEAPDLGAPLGARIVEILRNRFDYLALLESEAAVRAVAPDMGALRRLPVRGVIVTSRADPGAKYDFVSRFFAPGAGVDEDPVTGSAHCFLAPYWAARLGREELTGYQASARGGEVRVRLAGERVKLGGEAVTVMKGQLLV